MNVHLIPPSEQLRALGASPGTDAVRCLADAWLKTPEDLYRLSQAERGALGKALHEAGLHSVLVDLNQACCAVHERQPDVIEARARANAVVIEALEDPQALYKLPPEEWSALLDTSRQSGDPRAVEILHYTRQRVRDSQPEIIEAYEAVAAALANPAHLLTLQPKEWTRLLKTADAVPWDFRGGYWDHRQKLIKAKTDALIESRIAATPSSSIKHVGVHGQMSLALVRKIDAVIGTRWLTVPRLGIPRNRKEMDFKNGAPQAKLSACDAQWGPFHGIPEGGCNRTTSVICDTTSAVLLKTFGHTAFDVNVSLELERYFRSLEPFPWEQGGDA
jgi:hypothetical protein